VFLSVAISSQIKHTQALEKKSAPNKRGTGTEVSILPASARGGRTGSRLGGSSDSAAEPTVPLPRPHAHACPRHGLTYRTRLSGTR
jgi:hypothetical protein